MYVLFIPTSSSKPNYLTPLLKGALKAFSYPPMSIWKIKLTYGFSYAFLFILKSNLRLTYIMMNYWESYENIKEGKK
jgi:hypothetical protein